MKRILWTEASPSSFRTQPEIEQWPLAFGAMDPTQGFLDLLSRETYRYAHTHAHTHFRHCQALQSSCGLKIKQAFSLEMGDVFMIITVLVFTLLTLSRPMAPGGSKGSVAQIQPLLFKSVFRGRSHRLLESSGFSVFKLLRPSCL